MKERTDNNNQYNTYNNIIRKGQAMRSMVSAEYEPLTSSDKLKRMSHSVGKCFIAFGVVTCLLPTGSPLWVVTGCVMCKINPLSSVSRNSLLNEIKDDVSLFRYYVHIKYKHKLNKVNKVITI